MVRPVARPPAHPWLRALDSLAGRLRDHPEIRLIAFDVRPPRPRAAAALARRLGAALPAELAALYRQCDGLLLAWTLREGAHADATYDRAAHIAEGGSLDGVIDLVGASEALSDELRADLGFTDDDDDDLGGPFVPWDLGLLDNLGSVAALVPSSAGDVRVCLAAAGHSSLGRGTPRLSVRAYGSLLLASGGARDRSGYFLRRQDPAGAPRLDPTLAELLADPDLSGPASSLARDL